MNDFNVWYKGMIIGNLRADTLLKAKNAAKKQYSRPVVVSSVDATKEENDVAKAESLK